MCPLEVTLYFCIIQNSPFFLEFSLGDPFLLMGSVKRGAALVDS